MTATIGAAMLVLLTSSAAVDCDVWRPRSTKRYAASAPVPGIYGTGGGWDRRTRADSPSYEDVDYADKQQPELEDQSDQDDPGNTDALRRAVFLL